MRMFRMAMIATSLMLAGCQTTKMDTANIDTTKIDETETAAIDALELNPTTDVEMGKQQFKEANYGLAEKHFRKAVEANSDDAEALMGLAASYDQLGRFDFAERAYKELFKVAGRKPQIVSNYGYSQLLRGNKSEATKLFHEAAKKLPNDDKIKANQKLAS
ncbi:MAG: tetratricopeptide repeat protein [Rhizobiaceae bacterium]